MIYQKKKHIKENSNECPIALIGNKSDLDSERKVPIENGEKYAKDNNTIFFEASAKTGTNIEESILALGEIIIKNEMFMKDRERAKSEYVVSKSTTKNKSKKKCC